MGKRVKSGILFVAIIIMTAIAVIGCAKAQQAKDVYFVEGIDIAQHQGDIDTTQIDVEFVVVRMGYRGYEKAQCNLDLYFKQNMEKLSDYEGEIALYWASHSISIEEVQEENAFIVNELNKLAPEMRNRIKYFFIDREKIHDPKNPKSDIGRADYISKELFNELLSAQVEGLTKMMDGVKVGVYTNVEYLKTMVDYEKLGDVPYWIAWYGENVDTTSFESVINRVAKDSFEAANYLEENIVMWQYSDKGTHPVSKEKVDLNIVSSEMFD